MSILRSTTLILMALALAACASNPKRNGQLEHARSAVQALASEPLASQAASAELAMARRDLAAAESAFERHENPQTVNHHAYLATRRARSGKPDWLKDMPSDEIAQGEAERTRVLLEARTAEAKRAAERAAAARSDAAMQQSAAKSAETEADAIRQQLADLKAQQTERGMVLSLGDVLFDTDRAALKAGAQLTMTRLADFLKQYSQTHVRIEGHTDSTGSAEYNVALSQRRAAAVADALRARGVLGSANRHGRPRRTVSDRHQFNGSGTAAKSPRRSHLLQCERRIRPAELALTLEATSGEVSDGRFDDVPILSIASLVKGVRCGRVMSTEQSRHRQRMDRIRLSLGAFFRNSQIPLLRTSGTLVTCSLVACDATPTPLSNSYGSAESHAFQPKVRVE